MSEVHILSYAKLESYEIRMRLYYIMKVLVITFFYFCLVTSCFHHISKKMLFIMQFVHYETDRLLSRVRQDRLFTVHLHQDISNNAGFAD